MDFSKPDLNDKDALLFSEYLWSTVHGDQPFPKAYFGAHRKGLKALGLKTDPLLKDDDDRGFEVFKRTKGGVLV